MWEENGKLTCEKVEHDELNDTERVEGKTWGDVVLCNRKEKVHVLDQEKADFSEIPFEIGSGI